MKLNVFDLFDHHQSVYEVVYYWEISCASL